ncbi:MAG: hypothetical protein PHC52_00680 [Syntrophales bacterium]|nr:hypothetical protein [Syntrophales bacterium]
MKARLLALQRLGKDRPTAASSLDLEVHLEGMLAKIDESADLLRDLLYGKTEAIRRLVLDADLPPVASPPEGPPEEKPPGK